MSLAGSAIDAADKLGVNALPRKANSSSATTPRLAYNVPSVRKAKYRVVDPGVD